MYPSTSDSGSNDPSTIERPPNGANVVAEDEVVPNDDSMENTPIFKKAKSRAVPDEVAVLY